MNNVALICVIHDPTLNKVSFVNRIGPLLKEIYKDMYVTVSQETSKALREELVANAFKVKVIPKKGAAHARREVLKFGLTGGNDYFHYCDLDRLLTWADRYRDELKSTVNETSGHDYIILGRTERAFSTHPVEWVETEKITNKIFSLELGEEVDVTAGSCGFSRQSAQLISENSKDKMTDAEWAMIVHRIGKKKVSYRAVEGLEYREELNGYSKEVNGSEKWFNRVRLCYIISESAINTGKERQV
ncbi:hypothetical protein ACPWSR_03455 [Alloiococcus sp. CFN-8]|uniref:hypothetical protein n=1 Tax=Alloiococcus sp. CFN-8 TaxID=3416081 RepID=UPI003CF385E2